jgi:hypothetical protein
MLASTVVAVLVTVAGCGGGTRKPAVVSGAEVYAATVDADSAYVQSTVTFTTGDLKAHSTATESGPFAWSSHQGELGMTLTAAGEAPTSSQEIIDGNDTYNKTTIKGLPAGALSGIPGINGWSESVSSGDISGVFSQGIWGLFGATSGQISPPSVLALLRTDASSVTDLGPQTIGAVRTTHYQEHLDLTRLGVPKADLKVVEEILGSSSFRVDYWVDSSRLLRQLRLVFTENRAPSIPTTTTTTVAGESSFSVPFVYPITLSLILQLSDYGIPVHVVPPPPSEINSHQTCTATADSISCQ